MRKIERAITLVCIIALVPCIMEQETDLELFILATETMTESRFFFYVFRLIGNRNTKFNI